MKVSIIIPVYNVEEYITRCFQSVCNQTYDEVLIECIFVDDCGSDNSVDILRSLIDSYQGEIEFKILHHEVNKGLSEARNSGTKVASGEYVYYFDSDDEITNTCISQLVGLASKYQGVDMVMGSTEIIGAKGQNNSYKIKSEIPEFCDDPLWLKASILKRTYLPITAWNKLIRLKFLRDNNLFFKAGIIHEDEHWEFFVAKYIKSAAFCEAITYKHYINEGSIVTTASTKKVIDNLLIIVEDFIKNIDSVLPHKQYKSIYYLSFYILIKSMSIRESEAEVLVKKTLQMLLKDRFREVKVKLKVIDMLVLLVYFMPGRFVNLFKISFFRITYYGLLRLV